MELEIVHGQPRNHQAALDLANALRDGGVDGTVYLGYPVLASADERVAIDALLVSLGHGLVAFQLQSESPVTEAGWQALAKSQDQLYAVLESNLGRHESLRRGRKLAFDIATVTVLPAGERGETDTGGYYCALEDVADVVKTMTALESEPLLNALQSCLQRVNNIRPAKKRAAAQTPSSRGGVMKTIEREIANLDRWQKRAAIETPEGPQRLRGLAGSGKTIVLALKAAYLHAQHPDWLIAVTFQSRALYQQFEDLITRFSFEHSNDKPDFERLRLLHSWGGGDRHGVYTAIAERIGAPVRDLSYARNMFVGQDPFGGACQELLDAAQVGNAEPIFDAVLIDEAQDLPPEFFRLVHRFVKEPKRVVWGYDELQKLSEAGMPSTRELFGADEQGNELVSLANVEGEARRDIILPKCYRNPPWTLATAHALGFGVFREGGLVQHFDEPTLWSEIGYAVLKGELIAGSEVVLERSTQSYPRYFSQLLNRDDSIMFRGFASEAEQDAWVAAEIRKNLAEDELESDDILIVLPEAYTSRSRGRSLTAALARQGIAAHLVGVTSSRDEVFRKGSVAITHIFRAKGNEAPMVYAVDSEHASNGYNLITRRNTLFTALTRSRAWIRVTGVGVGMDALLAEFNAIRERQFHLQFVVPTSEELRRLRRIHRDRPEKELQSAKRATEGLEQFFEAIDNEEIELDHLPARLRTKLALLTRQKPGGNDGSNDS